MPLDAVSPAGANLGTFPAGNPNPQIQSPGAIAFDGTHMWVVNGDNAVTEL